MNPMTINPKFASLFENHCQSCVKGKPSAKGSKDFFSIIQESKGVGLPLKKGCHPYLESLRKRLLAEGKPLNKVSLRGKDIPLLKKFLYHCGYAQEKVEKFIKGLSENNPEGGINLSQFFLKIAELGPPNRNGYQAVTIEPSAIPYIESALRDFGLTPKEVDYAFSATMVKGGGLDLAKFVINLKKITNITNKGLLKPDQNSVHQISNNGKVVQTSIKDLITALEQMTGRPGQGNQLPNEVKATIGHILESVVIAEQKHEAISYLRSLSKLRLTNSISKKQTGKEGKVGINPNDGQQKVEVPYLPRKGGSPPHLDVEPGLKKVAKEEMYSVKSEKTKIHIPHQMTGSNFSEAINTVKQNPNNVRDSLPAYLIDQVGKQISRSVLRGEKVIRLQLKPPDLGALKIEMDIKDNVLKLGMIAENNSVKELLQSNVHVLREALVEHGVKLEKIDIQINYDFDQSLSNLKEGPKEEQGEDQAINGAPFLAEDDKADPLSGHRIMVTGDHLLDLMA